MANIPTASELIQFMSASTSSAFVQAATPSSESLEVIEQCIGAAANQVISYCMTLDTDYPDEVKLAIRMHAVTLFEGRTNAFGVITSDQFGAVRVPSSFSPQVLALLADHKAYRFST